MLPDTLVRQREPGLLSNSDFVKFWSGETVSVSGTEVTEMALLLTAIVTLQASPAQIGLLTVARYVPYVALSLFAGVWFDRYRRRPALIVCNLFRAALIGLVPFAFAFDLLSINLLYLVSFGIGLASVVFDVGALSFVPHLVERRHLTEANGKIQASYSLAAVAGPGLGGWLVTLLGGPIALIVDVGSYLFSAVSLIAIKRPEPEPEPAQHESVLRSIAEGLRTVIGDRVLWHLATQSAVFNLFESFITTVFAVYVVRDLGLSAVQLGLVLGVGACGALCGALVADRLTQRLGFVRTLRLSTIGACVAPLILLFPSDASTTSLTTLVLGLALHGANLTIFNVNSVTLRQSVTPAGVLGRMNASYRLVLYITVPLGAAIGAALTGVLPLQTVLIIGIVGIASPMLWLFFSAAYRISDPNTPPIAARRARPAHRASTSPRRVTSPAHRSTTPAHRAAGPAHRAVTRKSLS